MQKIIFYILIGLTIVFLLGFIISISFIAINNKKNKKLVKQLLNKISSNTFNGSDEDFKLKRKLEDSIKKYNQLIEDNQKLNDDCQNKLNQIANINKEEAKKQILFELEQSLKKEKSNLIKNYELSTKQELQDKFNQFVIDSFEGIDDNFISDKTSYSIKLDDDAIKGKIIGKDGRNKKSFERITGVDLIIEKEPEVTISCFNPIRREIAKNVLEKLLISKNIDSSRIEKYYEIEVDQMIENTKEIGRKTLEETLNIFDVNSDIFEYVGRLKFRTSYGQNILNHSIECAMIATNIARMMNVDEVKARKAAFFHDIGKSVDFEIDNDHVESGLKIAKEIGLDDYIVNTIESHHDKVPPNNIYASIAKMADKISASKPGARFMSFEEYIKRVTTIEDVCNQVNGVKNSYAIKAGKQVRIIVDSKLIDDDSIVVLANEIKHKLEDNNVVNKQPIEIVVIRENIYNVKTNEITK